MRRLTDKRDRAARDESRFRELFRAHEPMLLAERADEINVAPRDAAFAERNRLGEKIELGIGRSQSIDTLARNHCGERVTSAFGPQRKVTGRHRVEMRIEHERRERAVTSLDDREQIDLLRAFA